MTELERDKYRIVEELDYVLDLVLQIKNEVNAAETDCELASVVADHINVLDILFRLD